jgi:hypothetical protein
MVTNTLDGGQQPHEQVPDSAPILRRDRPRPTYRVERMAALARALDMTPGETPGDQANPRPKAR